MKSRKLSWLLIGILVALFGLMLPVGIMHGISSDNLYNPTSTATTLFTLEEPLAVPGDIKTENLNPQPGKNGSLNPDQGITSNLNQEAGREAIPDAVVAEQNTSIDDQLLIDQALSAESCMASEGFDTIVPSGWISSNLSDPLGTSGWYQGDTTYFDAHSGAASSYIAADFKNTAGLGTISNWLIGPMMTLMNGDKIRFYTRTSEISHYPDRLQLRLSINGTSIEVGSTENSVGDFATLLLDINPTLVEGGYPETWTRFEVTISGLDAPITGRIAFRYFVSDSGTAGSNGNYIGIDTFSVCRQSPPAICSYVDGFDSVPDSGWTRINMSDPTGVLRWYQGYQYSFIAHTGVITSYAAANFLGTAGTGTISNWLISPEISFMNGDTVIFYTRTILNNIRPDRLQVRLSRYGDSTNVGSTALSVGDFNTLLVDINPDLIVGSYPESWSEYRLVIRGLTEPTTGRIAFRHFVTDGGVDGINSNYIGVDTFSICREGNFLPVIIKP